MRHYTHAVDAQVSPLRVPELFNRALRIDHEGESHAAGQGLVSAGKYQRIGTWSGPAAASSSAASAASAATTTSSSTAAEGDGHQKENDWCSGSVKLCRRRAKSASASMRTNTHATETHSRVRGGPNCGASGRVKA